MLRNFYLGFTALALLALIPGRIGFSVICAVLAGFCLGKLRQSQPWIFIEEDVSCTKS